MLVPDSSTKEDWQYSKRRRGRQGDAADPRGTRSAADVIAAP